ncbi:LPS export ABC transporter permease LptF [Paraferrimonas haliotis]|uniref:Lipopolysaccharide export system permease protein LptF n=1 Tax=Paraferrimonas haliotis TaxID=2013866 RepID=A0AA37TRT6_9GAMM|nr:LPS export ABC transporter permease LptF [Paraferrimonas haliotis]
MKAQAAVLFVLLTIFISQNFVRVLADASEGQFPAGLVATIMALNLPWLSALIVPLSLFLGVLLAHGRMYAESEMTVMHAVGVSEWYVARVTLLLAVFNMVIAGALSLYIAPWAQEKEAQILEKARSEAGLAALVQGRFQQAANGQAVIFVEKLDKNATLERVFVAHLPKDVAEGEEPEAPSVVVANSGQIIEDRSGGQRLKLDDGVRYQGGVGRVDYQITEFGDYQMQIKEQAAEERRRRLSALPLNELRAMDTAEANAEFHWRLAIPLALPIMVLMAVPLSRVNTRQGKFAKIGPAILLYLGYFGMLVAGRRSLEDGVLPEQLGLWWVHLFGLIIAIIMIAKERPIGLKFMGLLSGRLNRDGKQEAQS